MATLLFVAILLLAVSVIAAAFLIRTKKDTESGREEITRLIASTVEMLDRRIQHVAQLTQHAHSSTQNVIRDVVGQLEEQRAALARVLEQSKDIARLQEILQPPKARGAMGEQLLENILTQHLPGGEKAGLWERQYAFHSGERVDFVIRAGELLIPIDSKFPLEAYERLKRAPAEEREKTQKDFAAVVRRHSEAVQKKYIVPQEGTADFALLYIPSEGVYAEVISMPELTDAIFHRSVIPVSPGTFFAYLRTILIGLRGLQITSSAREILAGLKALEHEFSAFGERFRITGGHIRDAARSFEDAEHELSRLSGRLDALDRIHESEHGVANDKDA